jgi:hypothetical protein
VLLRRDGADLQAQMYQCEFPTPAASLTLVFSTCARPEEGGGVKRIIMGLDRNQKCVCFPG